MRSLTRDDCFAWIRNSFTFKPDDAPVRFGGAAAPVRSTQIVHEWDDALALSMAICDALAPDRQMLLFAEDWGIFHSRQDLALYMAFCRGCGLEDDVRRYPGAEYWRHESRTLQSHLALMILFMWDVVVLPDTASSLVKISHDGPLHLFSDKGTAQQFDPVFDIGEKR